MKTSAGAADSICLARVGLAAYDTTTLRPVWRWYSALTSSSAFLRLAAANTSTSRPCARARPAKNPANRNRRMPAPADRPRADRFRRLLTVSDTAWGRAGGVEATLGFGVHVVSETVR